MKRILVSLVTVGVLSALLTGATFALFTAQTEPQDNTFSAGTVSFGRMTEFKCSPSSNLAPGDIGRCVVKVTYSGSLDAWVGVDHRASGDLFTGDHPMTYTINGKSDPGTILLGRAQNGDELEVRVEYSFPKDAGNEYQGKSGTIHLTVKAVQARKNTNRAEDGPSRWD